MEISFENQGTRTYLVYTVGENDVVDSMSLGMLTNNRIPGLAQTLYTQMNDTKYLKYDVSAKISVKQFFTGQVNKKRLLGVFNGIVDAMLSAEEYMIDVNAILLDLDYIFADVSNCETVLVCLPLVLQEQSTRDMGTFFKNIMFCTQFDQTENCDYVAQIINYLNRSSAFSLDDFKKLLDTINGGMMATVSAQQSNVQGVQVQQAPLYTQQSVQPPIQRPVVSQPMPQNIQSQNVQPPISPNVQRPTQGPIYGAQPVQHQQYTQPVQQVNQDKKISMMGLLMHYSKENAELYKAQKAAKKNGQMSPQPTLVTPKQNVQAGFAIPGQMPPKPNQGFVIPGQQVPLQPSQVVEAQKPMMPIPQTQMKVEAKQFAQPISQPIPQPVQSQPMNFGETTVLGGGGIGETTVLNATQNSAQMVIPYLVRVKTNERINLNKPVFRVGKERTYVDYFVGDNASVSRSHANFITKEGTYYVVDTNSTNHTYVNGAMIQSNVETALSHGDKVRLANEEFEFKLY